MPPVTDERLAELTDRLENGIKELYASGRYAEYLAAMSKFHHYSFGNALLILLQCPTATSVAGYNDWKKKFGRQVKRYEKGIQILAPCHFTYLVEYEKRDPDTGQTLYGPDGKPLTEKRRENATRFRIATVFDVSQTEGRELPSLVSELSGDVPDFENVYARLAALCPLPVELGPVPGTAKGYASFAENRVVVRSGMSQVQTIKTLIHETAHAKLHPPDFLSENPKPRQEKEVEAESVAYVVCQHFGIDTSDYSLGYVAGWSRGKELAELKASLNVIHATAGEIINAIQPPPPELTRDELSQEYQRRTNYRKSRKRK
ncbi:MAG: hypothetical protein HFG02_01860 [Oscillibacter sp.]|nr:hypothetical protein [Oscillibacter sp.]